MYIHIDISYIGYIYYFTFNSSITFNFDCSSLHFVDWHINLCSHSFSHKTVFQVAMLTNIRLNLIWDIRDFMGCSISHTTNKNTSWRRMQLFETWFIIMIKTWVADTQTSIKIFKYCFIRYISVRVLEFNTTLYTSIKRVQTNHQPDTWC